MELFRVSEDERAIALLEKRGWICSDDFVWRMPECGYRPSEKEWRALCDEWDYAFDGEFPEGEVRDE